MKSTGCQGVASVHWVLFPEEDDNQEVRAAYADDNLKANEYLYRRVEIEDVVSAHLLALRRAPAIGFRNTLSALPRHSRPMTWRPCVSTCHAWCGSGFRVMKANTSAAVEKCFQSSIECM
jgi:hypothetical protein